MIKSKRQLCKKVLKNLKVVLWYGIIVYLFLRTFLEVANINIDIKRFFEEFIPFLNFSMNFIG